MNPTVYIETTIIGHLTTRLPQDLTVVGQMAGTRKWWKESRHQFELFTSEVVISELSQGDPQAAAERLNAVAEIPLIPVMPTAPVLADFLLAHHALPAKARVDVLHLAIAATSAIDYLLTWNCLHLANATLQAKINAACRDRGFEPPIICTPDQLSKVRL